jgi:hypothetical protein
MSALVFPKIKAKICLFLLLQGHNQKVENQRDIWQRKWHPKIQMTL